MAKNIVITGANRGVGLALTQLFIEQGNNVYALCRQSSPALDSTEATVVTSVDVTTEVGIKNMVSALSGITIDVLVCNAGIWIDDNLEKFTLDSMRKQFEVNTLAPLNVVHALQKQLTAGTKVAMITSRMGSIADNDSGGRLGYRMSKAALNAASMSLSHDLAEREISVGMYHPGWVQTDMGGGNAEISADDSASKLVTLINQLDMGRTGEFRHVNGQVLPW